MQVSIHLYGTVACAVDISTNIDDICIFVGSSPRGTKSIPSVSRSKATLDIHISIAMNSTAKAHISSNDKVPGQLRRIVLISEIPMDNTGLKGVTAGNTGQYTIKGLVIIQRMRFLGNLHLIQAIYIKNGDLVMYRIFTGLARRKDLQLEVMRRARINASKPHIVFLVCLHPWG